MNQEQLEVNIKARQEEINGYQVNIDNYTCIIEMLPMEWEEHLIQYKSLDTETIVNNVPDEYLELVSDLNFKDTLIQSLKAEKLEQRKVNFILKALEKQICM